MKIKKKNGAETEFRNFLLHVFKMKYKNLGSIKKPGDTYIYTQTRVYVYIHIYKLYYRAQWCFELRANVTVTPKIC